MRIVFDLDDVTALFTKRVNELLGTSYKVGDSYQTEDWNRVRSHQRIFAQLEVDAQIRALIKNLKWNHEVEFLTALPHDTESLWKWAPYDKFNWVDYHFPGIPVFFGPHAHQKYMHCHSQGDILIDDKLSNCQEWEQAGGLAHQYTDPDSCKIWLQQQRILI